MVIVLRQVMLCFPNSIKCVPFTKLKKKNYLNRMKLSCCLALPLALSYTVLPAYLVSALTDVKLTR